MNISKMQRTSMIGIAAIALAGSGVVGSSASAGTDTPGGPGGPGVLTHHSTGSGSLPQSPDAVEGWTAHRSPAVARFPAVGLVPRFDEAEYVAARKAAQAQDRVDRARLFR